MDISSLLTYYYQRHFNNNIHNPHRNMRNMPTEKQYRLPAPKSLLMPSLSLHKPTTQNIYPASRNEPLHNVISSDHLVYYAMFFLGVVGAVGYATKNN